MVAEPRVGYERRARKRRATAVRLRLQGLTYREIAEQANINPGSVGQLLMQARRNGEWAAAVECHRGSHAE
ncbi:sigma factor-like helix-turn-helix DNA-binding protein [Pseudonocardia sp. ICBG1142]